MGWWIALTMVLNGAWLVTSQFGSLLGTVVVMALLLAALGWTFHRAVVTKEHQSPWLDAVLIDGVTGLHLGWVSVATVANVAAWLTATGPASWEARAHLWAITMLVVVLIIGTRDLVGERMAADPAVRDGLGLPLDRAGAPASASRTPWDVGVAALIVAALLVLVPGTARVALPAAPERRLSDRRVAGAGRAERPRGQFAAGPNMRAKVRSSRAGSVTDAASTRPAMVS